MADAPAPLYEQIRTAIRSKGWTQKDVAEARSALVMAFGLLPPFSISRPAPSTSRLFARPARAFAFWGRGGRRGSPCGEILFNCRN